MATNMFVHGVAANKAHNFLSSDDDLRVHGRSTKVSAYGGGRPINRPTTVRNVWQRAFKKVLTNVRGKKKREGMSRDAIKIAIEEISSEQIQQRKGTFRTLPHDGCASKKAAAEDDENEEVIKLQDMWNILEGMGSFISHADLDDFMMTEMEKIDKDRQDKVATTTKRGRKKSFLGAFVSSKAPATVAPSDDGQSPNQRRKSRKKSFIMGSLYEVANGGNTHDLRRAAKMVCKERRGTIQKSLQRGLTRRKSRNSLHKTPSSIATDSTASDDGPTISRAEFRSILRNYVELSMASSNEEDTRAKCVTGTAVAVRRDPFTVPCDEHWRVWWDMSTMVLIFYVALVQPVRFGFGWESEIGSGFWYFETFVDMVFLGDLLLNFRTGYINNRGKMELRTSKIAIHYLRGNFAIDLVSSVPWDIILTPFIKGDSKLTENTRVLKAVRLVKLSRLGRLARVKKIIQQIEDVVQIDPELKSVVLATAVMILIAHILACIWGSVARFSDNGIYVDSWYVGVGAADAGIVSQYIYALYWSVTTVTTVGYGDISPQSEGEMLFASLAMVLAGMFYGFVVATISAYFLSTDVHLSHLNSNMKKLKAYTRLRNFPTSLERQVHSYFSHYYRHQFMEFDEMRMLTLLPHVLSVDVASFLSKTILSRHFVFSGIPERDITRVLRIMKPGRADAGHYMVHIGDPCREMFVLRKGIVCVTDAHQRSVAEYREHSTLLEFALIPQLVKSHHYNVLAMTNSEYFAITADDFFSIMRKKESILRRVRHNIEIMEAARALSGVSLVLDPLDHKNVSQVFDSANDAASAASTVGILESLVEEKRSKASRKEVPKQSGGAASVAFSSPPGVAEHDEAEGAVLLSRRISQMESMLSQIVKKMSELSDRSRPKHHDSLVTGIRNRDEEGLSMSNADDDVGDCWFNDA